MEIRILIYTIIYYFMGHLCFVIIHVRVDIKIVRHANVIQKVD